MHIVMFSNIYSIFMSKVIEYRNPTVAHINYPSDVLTSHQDINKLQEIIGFKTDDHQAGITGYRRYLLYLGLQLDQNRNGLPI